MEGPSPEEFRVYRRIACRELYETDYWSTLSFGKILPDHTSEDTCGDMALTDPIDVKDWPFHGTIYYFSGETDPATPPYMAKYHFNNQTFAKKILIQVKDGGHNALKVNLADCASPIWSAILKSDERIADTLKTCGLSTVVTRSP